MAVNINIIIDAEVRGGGVREHGEGRRDRDHKLRSH
jgi:hypothetical protein